MKNRLLNIALLSLIIAFISCNKITESIQQDLILNDTVYFDIPALSTITTETTIPDISSKINLENEIGNNRFAISDVKTTKLTSLNLTLVDEENKKDTTIDTANNFGNLETLTFRIASNGNFRNLDTTTISSRGTSGFLTLTPTIAPDSLKPFLINPSKTYNIIVKAKKITTTPMKVQVAARYTITLSK